MPVVRIVDVFEPFLQLAVAADLVRRDASPHVRELQLANLRRRPRISLASIVCANKLRMI